MLSFQNASLEEGSPKRQILSKISFDIFPGDFILLLGSNGSGKSSLIKLINGLCHPSQGDLFLDGRSLGKRSVHERSRSIVTLTQDLNLATFSDLTVFENCIIALHRTKTIFSPFRRIDRENFFAAHLGRFHSSLPKRLHAKTGSLSGGERQILAFALTLFSKPKLLLLDEHTSALDPEMAEKLMEITDSSILENRTTALMTTHNLDHALRYGNRTIALKQGKIIMDTRKKLSRTELLAFYS